MLWRVPCPGGLGCPQHIVGIVAGVGSGNGPRPAPSAQMAGWIPARAALAFLFWAALERAGCCPTWVALTWSCCAGGS